jgi:hypothetical protein
MNLLEISAHTQAVITLTAHSDGSIAVKAETPNHPALKSLVEFVLGTLDQKMAAHQYEAEKK